MFKDSFGYVYDEFMCAIFSSMFNHTSVVKNFDCFKYCVRSGVFLKLLHVYCCHVTLKCFESCQSHDDDLNHQLIMVAITKE